jgi:hypothetical protein
MTDHQIFQLFAGVYEHLRTLHIEMRVAKAVALATKDALADSTPLQQTESLYLVAYKKRLQEASAANEQIIALIDAQL